MFDTEIIIVFETKKGRNFEHNVGKIQQKRARAWNWTVCCGATLLKRIIDKSNADSDHNKLK